MIVQIGAAEEARPIDVDRAQDDAHVVLSPLSQLRSGRRRPRSFLNDVPHRALADVGLTLVVAAIATPLDD